MTLALRLGEPCHIRREHNAPGITKGSATTNNYLRTCTARQTGLIHVDHPEQHRLGRNNRIHTLVADQRRFVEAERREQRRRRTGNIEQSIAVPVPIQFETGPTQKVQASEQEKVEAQGQPIQIEKFERQGTEAQEALVVEETTAQKSRRLKWFQFFFLLKLFFVMEIVEKCSFGEKSPDFLFK